MSSGVFKTGFLFMLTSVLKHESCYMGLVSVVNSSVYNSASISFPVIRTDLNNWTAACYFLQDRKSGYLFSTIRRERTSSISLRVVKFRAGISFLFKQFVKNAVITSFVYIALFEKCRFGIITLCNILRY